MNNLQRAYDECVKLHGRDAAVSAVEKVTGQMFVGKVADNQIAAVIAALTGGTATAQAAPRDRLRLIHNALGAMARSIYRR